MSFHRTLIRLSALLAVVALAKGCGDGESPSAPPMPEPARPTTVTVSPATHELTALGATVQLTAEAFDANGHRVAGAEFSWESSDPSVATVDAAGLVTGVAEGTATITASAGDVPGTTHIAVPEHPARSPIRRPELLTYTHHTTSSALGGSEVSLGRFLQDQLVQCQVRHCSLQAPVLALELLQAPCLAHLHPAVLPPPPGVRLLGDAELPADQLHGFAAGQTDLCLPQCSDDLLRSVSLPSPS